MNVGNVRQRLLLKNIGQSLLRVLRRFPVGVTLLFFLSLMLAVFLTEPHLMSRAAGCLFYFFWGGLLIDLVVSLWGEEQAGRRRPVAEGVLFALWAAYCIWLYTTDYTLESDWSFLLGNAAWITAVMVLVPFVPFLGEKDDLKAWHFMMSLFLALLTGGLVSGVMLGGMEGLVLGTVVLFDINYGTLLPRLILSVCLIFLFGMLFLSLVPEGERKHNDSAGMSPLLKKTVSWLLLPLLGCYMAVLYVYGVRILVHWELPKGMLSWLVSVVMGGYVLCYMLLYPVVTDRQSWQSRLLTCWMPAAILPLLVLMTVGVIRRFADYGVTTPRLYLLTLLLWFYAVCIVIMLSPRKRFRWIYLSFAALFLLSSGQPFNYFHIGRKLMKAGTESVVSEKELQQPLEQEVPEYNNPSL